MKTNNFVLIAAVPLLFCGLASGQTTGAGMQAPEGSDGKPSDVQIFGGLRLWAANWDSAVPTRITAINPTNPSMTVTRDVDQRFSSTRVAPIPFLGVRYGSFIASASYLPRTAYSSDGLLTGDLHRDELDLTLGYYVLPQLALSVGYKTAKVDKVSPLIDGGSKTDVILFGVSGSVPLDGSARLSLYGNFAYGQGRTKFDFALANGDTKVNVGYRIGEVGLSYKLLSAPQGALKQLSLSLGYRAQVLTLKDVSYGTYATPVSTAPVSVERRNVQSVTDGVVIGLIGVF